MGRGLPRRRDPRSGRDGNRPDGAGRPAGDTTPGTDVGGARGGYDDATASIDHEHTAAVLLVDDNVAHQHDRHDRHDQHNDAATDEHDHDDNDAAPDEHHDDHNNAATEHDDNHDDQPVVDQVEPDLQLDVEPDLEHDELDDVGHHIRLRDDDHHHNLGPGRRNDVLALTPNAAAGRASGAALIESA